MMENDELEARAAVLVQVANNAPSGNPTYFLDQWQEGFDQQAERIKDELAVLARAREVISGS